APDRVARRPETDGARFQPAGIFRRPLRGQRPDRRDDELRVRYHGVRRLQRHSLLVAEAGARAVLARRRRPAGDRDGRGSPVPEKAGGVHDAVDSGAEGCQTVAVQLRSGVGARVGEVPAGAVQVSTARGSMAMTVQRYRPAAVGVIAALALSAASLVAHHATTAFYDSSKKVEAQGKVTKFVFMNPHAYLYIDAPNASGTVVTWQIELGAPISLKRTGWTPDTI